MLSGSLVLASCALRMTLGSAMFYDVSLATEARGRSRASTTGVVGEAEANPQLGLSWLDHRSTMRVSYFPRLALQDRGGGVQPLHRALLAGTWGLDGGWSAAASADGAYGTNDFLRQEEPSPDANPNQQGQPSTTPAQVQPVPQLTALKYASGEVSFSVEGPLLPRCELRGQVAAFVAGGADGPSRAQLPIQRGGRLGGGLQWSASGSDVLASALTLTMSKFETGKLDGIALVSETWRHTHRGGAQTRLGAGLGATATREAGRTAWTFAPNGEAGVHDQWLGALDVDLGVQVAAVIDRVTAGDYDRADAIGSLSWRFAPRWTLSASGSGGIAIEGDQAGDKITAGELRAAWAPGAAWELSAGVRAFSQIPHDPLTQRISEGTVFVAVAVRDRDRL
jgi:hypothetical protein